MPHIVIISASVRAKRQSHRVALYFKNYLEENKFASVEILDLNEYQFPIFNERLKYQADPQPKTIEFAEKIRSADGVLIVTPEYNGGYPAALKNVIDLLIDEWKRKPTAICTVSDGGFGGMQDAFDEEGKPTDKTATDKRAENFIKELLWCIEAAGKMK
jgi:NAD(P)H-dependent FMN reductase